MRFNYTLLFILFSFYISYSQSWQLELDLPSAAYALSEQTDGTILVYLENDQTLHLSQEGDSLGLFSTIPLVNKNYFHSIVTTNFTQKHLLAVDSLGNTHFQIPLDVPYETQLLLSSQTGLAVLKYRLGNGEESKVWVYDQSGAMIYHDTNGPGSSNSYTFNHTGKARHDGSILIGKHFGSGWAPLGASSGTSSYRTFDPDGNPSCLGYGNSSTYEQSKYVSQIAKTGTGFCGSIARYSPGFQNTGLEGYLYPCLSTTSNLYYHNSIPHNKEMIGLHTKGFAVLGNIGNKTFVTRIDCDATEIAGICTSSLTNSNIQICQNDSYTFQDSVISSPGIYEFLSVDESGCESPTILNVSQYEYYSNVEEYLSVEICEGETFEVDGTHLGEAGVYEFNLSTPPVGCDSLLTVDLTIIESSEEYASYEGCEDFTINGSTYFQTGYYMQSFTNQFGCDSTLMLDITVHEVYDEFLEPISSCEYYEHNGVTYTASGSFTHHYVNQYSCDSSITFELEILAPSETFLQQTSCEPITWFDSQLTATGIYTHTLPNSVGCDSVIHLDFILDALDTSVLIEDNTLLANADNVTYQWFNCDNDLPIPNANLQVYTPTIDGNYKVEISDANCTISSSCFFVGVTNNKEVDAEIIMNAFPNPTKGIVHIESLNQNNKAIDIRCFDISGKLILQKKSTNQIAPLDLQPFPDGLYFIKVEGEGFLKTFRIFKE